MPSRLATSTAASVPTRSCSGTKNVLTERPNPVHMLRLPFIQDGFALTGQYRGVPGQPLLYLGSADAGYFDLYGDVVLIEYSSGSPFSSAAVIVKILNVDPAW